MTTYTTDQMVKAKHVRRILTTHRDSSHVLVRLAAWVARPVPVVMKRSGIVVAKPGQVIR